MNILRNPFRAQLSAAPLKQFAFSREPEQLLGIPRSIERGPVEAAAFHLPLLRQPGHSALN